MFAATAGLLLALAMQPPSVELHWQAPAGCPGQAALEREVAALLADHAAPPQATRPRLSFRVERQGALWQLHGEITSQGLSGQRELSAPSCEDLLAAAALLTAIVVDPGFGGPPEPTTTPAVTTVTPATVPAPGTTPAPAIVPAPATTPTKPIPASPSLTRKTPPRPPPARTPPTRARPGTFIHLASGLGLAALPAPAGLLRLTIGAHGRAWSLGLVQDLWLPRSGTVPDAPAVGGRFWLWSAGVRGCGLLHAGRVEFPLCAAIAVGAMQGRGTGELVQAYRRTSPWAAVTAGPGLRVAVTPRLGLTLAADLLVILARPRFAINGRGQACCDDTVGTQLTAGLELRLR